MRHFTCMALSYFLLQCIATGQHMGLNVSIPLFDMDIRPAIIDTSSQLNVANADNSRFVRLRSGHDLASFNSAILWKYGDSLSLGTDLGGFTEIIRLRTNGTMFLNSSLGIRLNAADMPMITRAWDAFTSGNYAGIGRWGLFMEQNFLTVGIPNVSNRGIQFVKYNPNSSVSSVMMRLQDGNLGIGQNNPLYRIDVEAAQSAMRMISTNSIFGSIIELRNMDNSGSVQYLGAINFNNPADLTPGQIAYAKDGTMIFRAGGSERMRIRHTTGFLGINNSDPMYMLDVQGDINLTGRLLTGSWFGFPGQVLTSTGDGPPEWKTVTEAVGFSAALDSTMSIPSGSQVVLAPFEDPSGFDDGNHFDASTGTFTAPADGLYYFQCKIVWHSTNAYNDVPVIIRLLLNGTGLQFGAQHAIKVSVNAAYGEDQHFATLLRLNEGDEITLTARQDSGATINVFANGGDGDTFFAGCKVY